MNELIKIETSTDGIQTVNARDLHVFLGVGKVFAAWIQDRIDQYGFEQGKDYEVFSDSGNKPQGGRPSKEYDIAMGEVPDPRFGTVKTYPKWVLEMVFTEDILV